MGTNKKREEYGSVMQSYAIRLKYTETVREDNALVKRTVEKSIDLDISPFMYGNAFSMAELIEFRDGANKILAEVRKLLLDGMCIEFKLIRSVSENVPEYTNHDGFPSSFRSLSFDRWEHNGPADGGEEDDEEGGLYLKPDTRYTDETRDAFLFWSKDILESLAECNI